ncbi:formyltransferase family protein, partial [Gaiella sp.]|uniref:methionyl-tRNA formyltransferase n=1 Tax=Gaiella sp. TaxID=2663207 RepID=UPI003263083B
VERAILAGDTETGVTIHETVKELDAGPIAAQRAFPIGDGDDAAAIFAQAARFAVELLDDVLAESSRHFVPQATEGVSYAEKIVSDDRKLDLADDPVALVRRVRALSPHIGARADLHSRPVTIWRARIGEAGAFEPLEVQPDGGQRMDAAAWLRGLR